MATNFIPHKDSTSAMAIMYASFEMCFIKNSIVLVSWYVKHFFGRIMHVYTKLKITIVAFCSEIYPQKKYIYTTHIFNFKATTLNETQPNDFMKYYYLKFSINILFDNIIFNSRGVLYLLGHPCNLLGHYS